MLLTTKSFAQQRGFHHRSARYRRRKRGCSDVGNGNTFVLAYNASVKDSNNPIQNWQSKNVILCPTILSEYCHSACALFELIQRVHQISYLFCRKRHFLKPRAKMENRIPFRLRDDT